MSKQAKKHIKRAGAGIAVFLLSACFMAGCGGKSPYEKYDDPGFENRQEDTDVTKEEEEKNSTYKDIKSEIKKKKEENAAQQEDGYDEAAAAEYQEYIDISSGAYKAASKFLRYLSEEDMDGMLNMLYISGTSIITRDNISAAIEESELKRFVGGTYTLDTCASKPGEEYAYFKASCMGETSIFRMKNTDGGWKVDLEPIYHFYVNDMHVIFSDSPSLTINGKKADEIKETPDMIYLDGMVAYDLAFPCYGVEVTAGFDGFEEKQLTLFQQDEKSSIFIYVLDDEEMIKKYTDEAIAVMEDLFDSENEERYSVFNEEMDDSVAENLKKKIDGIFKDTEVSKVSFSITDEDMLGCAVIRQDTFMVSLPTEVSITENNSETAIAGITVPIIIREKDGEYTLINFNEENIIDAVNKKATPKTEKEESEDTGENVKEKGQDTDNKDE